MAAFTIALPESAIAKLRALAFVERRSLRNQASYLVVQELTKNEAALRRPRDPTGEAAGGALESSGRGAPLSNAEPQPEPPAPVEPPPTDEVPDTPDEEPATPEEGD